MSRINLTTKATRVVNTYTFKPTAITTDRSNRAYHVDSLTPFDGGDRAWHVTRGSECGVLVQDTGCSAERYLVRTVNDDRKTVRASLKTARDLPGLFKLLKKMV